MSEEMSREEVDAVIAAVAKSIIAEGEAKRRRKKDAAAKKLRKA